MATASLSASTTISQITGFCEYAQFCVGGNGWDPFLAEVYLGHDSTSNIPQQVVWDAQLSDGFNTGWVDVCLDMPPGGAAPYPKLTVGGGTPLTHQGMTYGRITQVKIHAAVATAARMEWSALDVQFFKNGVRIDRYPPKPAPSPVLRPAVNTVGKSDGVTAEQILTITPDFSDISKVVIGGKILMASPSAILPFENDIFGQIYVFTSTCVPQMTPGSTTGVIPAVSTISSRLQEARPSAANGRGDGQRGRRKRRAGAR